MNSDPKLAVARAQLGTATYLFLNDLDPVSVQCLACGGGEVIDALSSRASVAPLSAHIAATNPSWDMKAIKAARNKYWNAFKHLTTRNGATRNDEAILESFDDTVNDTALFVAWTDYGRLTGQLPIEAQVLLAWWYCLHPEKLAPDYNFDVDLLFPRLLYGARSAQKAALRAAIFEHSKNPMIMLDGSTENAPLVKLA